jgi:hypothetical protein
MSKNLLVLLLLLYIHHVMGIIAYDCSSPESKMAVVSLLSEPVCTRKTHPVETKRILAQVLQHKRYDNIPYQQCLVTYQVTVTDCQRWFSNMHAATYSHVVELSEERCKDMHRYKSFNDPAFNNLRVYINAQGQGEFTGTVIGSNEGGSCKGGFFTPHKSNLKPVADAHVFVQINVKINKGYASLNIKDNELTFENGYTSNYNNLRSFDPSNGFTFWSKSVSKEECKQNKVFVVYEGEVVKSEQRMPDNSTKILYILEDDTSDREFLLEHTGNTSICGELSFTTQSTSLFVVESNNGIFKNKKDTNFNIRNLDNNLFLSMKISHLSHDIGRQVTEMYSDLMYEKCLSDSKIVSNMLSLARIDPKDWGYVYFKAPGFLGSVRSDSIYIQSCVPVNVTHRPTKECYQELPVMTVDNKPMFMTSRSRLLIEKGEQVECNNILANKYKLNGQWYNRVNGQLILSQKPVEVSISPVTDWAFNSMKRVADFGIYSSEEIESYSKVLFTPLNIPAEIANFINHVTSQLSIANRPDLHKAFTPNDFEHLRQHLTLNFFDKFKNAAISIGNFTSFVIGLFLIFKFVKFVANTIINAFIIGYAFGYCNFRMLFSCWDHMVSLFLHQEKVSTMKAQRKDNGNLEVVHVSKEAESAPPPVYETIAK